MLWQCSLLFARRRPPDLLATDRGLLFPLRRRPQALLDRFPLHRPATGRPAASASPDHLRCLLPPPLCSLAAAGSRRHEPRAHGSSFSASPSAPSPQQAAAVGRRARADGRKQRR
ncbi:hypothetical protein GUJ93_ZPchr0002g25696 [Zizania palustris]|uniref:Uncharacterized protein n=1 Tax=Zizania palustris TaxID=103762 RepID=A0A8J5SFJ5_ZIZPA|nr:hypothetical protein GUJ93_ZPchr0002g25696 [Zizania palustris]